MMNSKDRANNDIASSAAGGTENISGVRGKNRASGGVLGKTAAVGFSIHNSDAKHDGARNNTASSSSSSEDDPMSPVMKKKKIKTAGDEQQQQQQQQSPSSENRRGRRLSRPRRHRKVSAAPMKPMRRRVHEIKA